MTEAPNSMPTDHLPEGEEKRKAVQAMFDTVAPRYDLVNRLMTFRLDVRVRRQTLESLGLAPNSTVIDLACGTGDFVRALAKAGHRPIGIDLSYGMMAAAPEPGDYVQGDLLDLPVRDSSIDGAVCGYALRNLLELPSFFAELARVVKPGGRIALVDVSAPDNKLMKKGFDIHFNKIVPFVGGLLSDPAAYSYLPRSVAYLPPGAEMVQMLVDAGFVNAERQQLTMGIAQLLTADRP